LQPQELIFAKPLRTLKPGPVLENLQHQTRTPSHLPAFPKRLWEQAKAERGRVYIDLEEFQMRMKIMSSINLPMEEIQYLALCTANHN
jgi:hypothetical protein